MQQLLPKVAQSFFCLLVVLLFAACGNSYYRGPVTAHFDGRKFDNPWAPMFKAFNPLVLTPLGNDATILGAIPGMRVKALDWGENFELNRQVRFTLEPMQHWSARSLFDRREALWGAFVVEAPGGPIYFLADSGYAKALSGQFVARYGTPRFSLLPVGAYEPRWFMQYAHMNPAEAVQTYLDLGEGYAMGTQHEVFAMADEAYAAPRQTLLKALQAKGIDRERFLLPVAGGWFTVPPR